MKRIINGKTYNTATAEFVDSAAHDNDYEQYLNFEETLYRTRNGAFFLEGSGQGGTHWSTPAPWGGNDRLPGSGIKPLTREEALVWLEKYSDVETIESCFGELPQAGNDPSPLYVRCSHQLRASVFKAAEKSGKSVNGWIIGVLEESLVSSNHMADKVATGAKTVQG